MLVKFLVTYILILVSLKDVLSDGKIMKLGCEYAAKSDLLPIPNTGSSYIFLGNQEFHYHQGKDFNLNEKENYFPNKSNRRNRITFGKKIKKKYASKNKMYCGFKNAISQTTQKQ